MKIIEERIGKSFVIKKVQLLNDDEINRLADPAYSVSELGIFYLGGHLARNACEQRATMHMDCIARYFLEVGKLYGDQKTFDEYFKGYLEGKHILEIVKWTYLKP